ncbi:LysE/ArgO family amino acid transporter [Pseudomonadota bacterium]
MLYVFLKGFVLGLSIASLIGPIAILCIKKSLDDGCLSGFSIGLGAAVADGVYGSIAAFGLAVVTSFLTNHTTILRIIGGLFLLYLGIKAIRSSFDTKKIKAAKIRKNGALFKNFISTFFLTMTNPATIFAFIAIFAGLGVVGYKETLLSVIMVAGVFLGSAMFYLGLSFIIGLIGHKLSTKTIHKISIVSGLIILGFGGWSLLGLML